MEDKKKAEPVQEEAVMSEEEVSNIEAETEDTQPAKAEAEQADDGRAVGILEVFGLTTAFLAADAGCKAADVTLENFDKNKPANADALPVPLLVTIKFRGSVTDVQAAVDAGIEVAKATTGVVQSYVIPRPTADCCKMLKLNAFDKR